MEKIIKFVLFCLSSQGFAMLSCDHLEGIWWGEMSDESHLILDNPMPVVMKIKKNRDWYIGRFEMMVDKPSITSYRLLAKCQDGVINQIHFVDPKNSYCGIPSQAVMLNDPLKMELKWQNAMIDTKLHVNLVSIDKDTQDLYYPEKMHLPETCH